MYRGYHDCLQLRDISYLSAQLSNILIWMKFKAMNLPLTINASYLIMDIYIVFTDCMHYCTNELYVKRCHTIIVFIVVYIYLSPSKFEVRICFYILHIRMYLIEISNG